MTMSTNVSVPSQITHEPVSGFSWNLVWTSCHYRPISSPCTF